MCVLREREREKERKCVCVFRHGVTVQRDKMNDVIAGRILESESNNNFQPYRIR